MKFTTAFSLATLAVGVISEPVFVGRGTPVERDVPAITNVLNAVGAALTALDSAVNAFSGSSADVDSKAADLISTINTQAAGVPASGALTVGDAIGLTGPVQALQAVGATLVDDLISKKAAFEAAGLCKDLNSITSGIQTASNGLIDAIVKLVPDIVQPVAAELSAPFIASLAKGTAAYAPGSCVDAAGGGGGGSSSSSATTTTSASQSYSSSSATTSASTSATTSASHSVSSSASSASGTKTSSAASTTTTKPSAGLPTSSPPAQFTGAADMNRVAGSLGALALAAAAIVL